MKPNERIIIALDVDSANEAEYLVRILSEEIEIFKIGPGLFIQEGPMLIKRLRAFGARKIFLDLKIHDIPQTTQQTIKAVMKLGVDMVTCYVDQIDVFDGLDTNSICILGVTVLTSLSNSDLLITSYSGHESRILPNNNISHIDALKTLVLHRAQLAMQAGCHGVICSGLEVKEARKILDPKTIIVCPGIRFPCSDLNDQKRVVFPGNAVLNGATYIVIGRPVIKSDDPLMAVQKIVKDIEGESIRRKILRKE